MRRTALFAVALAVGLLAVAGCSSGERTVTVNHPAVAAPVYVDLGPAGPSAGDVRLFHFDGTSSDGQTVHHDTIMTTTGIVSGSTDEYRDTHIVFTFANAADQLILEGVAAYPGTGSTLTPSTTVDRPVIGGSGAFAGATGWAESTHNADGTWTHVFHIR